MEDKMDKNILLDIVKKAILEEFENKHLIDKSLYTQKEFLTLKATFVTLNLNGKLRGCIGSLIAHRNFLDDLIANAKSAAFNDPRFPPLSKKEFENIEIEISILSEPKILQYDDISDLKNKLRVGIDGVILKQGIHQATFLPSVWQQLPSFELFFNHLCLKARLNQDCLKSYPIIYTYQTQKIK
jgi:AmmeMemoRadiSam system protein A